MSDLNMQEIAKRGDLQAISTLTSRAIALRNVRVEAEMINGSLWLKIYPLATMQPNLCIQKIISLLNSIRPEKINKVKITEIGSDKKSHVWNRSIHLKKGKFVDNSNVNVRTFGILAAFLSALFISPVLFSFLWRSSTKVTVPDSTSQEITRSQQGSWYQGGTLVNADVLEWQQASSENKLATCGDLVSQMWSKKMLRPEIQNKINSMDDMRVLAEELKTQIDAATKQDVDPEENKKIYANQKVTDIAAALISSMNWTK